MDVSTAAGVAHDRGLLGDDGERTTGRGVVQDVDGCELSRIGRAWESVDRGDMVYVVSRRMRYATVRVHRAESAESLAAEVAAGRLPQYVNHHGLDKTRAENISVGSTDYPVLWASRPNVIAYVFIPSNEDGHTFVVRLDLPPMGEGKSEDWKKRRVGRLLRPLSRSLTNATVDTYRECARDSS